MITRTFLFLLAIVTGFSASNAADLSRPVLPQVGMSASVAEKYSAALETCGKAIAAASIMAQPLATIATTAHNNIAGTPDQIVPAPRTYRTDRARE